MSVYRINGVDPEITYKMIIERGIDAQVLNMPKLKDNGLSISWADENGTERYHGSRKFESQNLTIKCLIRGTNKVDALAKYNALKSFLTSTGEFNLDDVSKGRRWKLFYNSMPSLTTGSSWMRFTLELINDYPTDNFTIV